MPYKYTPDRCGIYKIVSPSGKFYIGSSVNIPERINKHKRHLQNKIHKNEVLQRAWEKYAGALKFEKILICEPKDLLFYEQLCIDGLKPEYNICRLASNTLGYKHTEETRAKLRAAMARRPPMPEETRLKISLGNKGKSRRGYRFSEEQKREMSERRKGLRHTEESKSKMSTSRKIWWINNEISLATRPRNTLGRFEKIVS